MKRMPLLPRDWLLLLFDGASRPVDRVRIQKSMFLFAERSKAPAHEKYDFAAYDYGPFSSAIYPDLAKLLSAGLLSEKPDSRSPSYLLTTQGLKRVKELEELAPRERVRLLHQLREWTLERNFDQLLTQIYSIYPKFAVRSIFRKS